VLLHIAVAALLIGAAFLHPSHSDVWGDKTALAGSIPTTMVSSIPLPTKAPPVDKSVLAPENVTKAAAPPPKEHTTTAPKPTDILVKSNTKPTAESRPPRSRNRLRLSKTAPPPQPSKTKHSAFATPTIATSSAARSPRTGTTPRPIRAPRRINTSTSASKFCATGQ
jgi:hypothetical protein